MYMTTISDGFRLQPGMSINPQGHLCLHQLDLVQAAQEFGTPLYLLNEETIRGNCRRYVASLAKEYPRARVVYAGKAFLCQAMCLLVRSEGLGLDVVSGGELHTAISVDFPAQDIIFHGVNRSTSELAQALAYGVGRIVVDNWAEAERVIEAASAAKTIAPILLRVSTGVEAHTHQYVQTSLIDSKFGFNLQELPEVVARLRRYSQIEIKGLHCHIGSQIASAEPFVQNLDTLLRTIADLPCDLQELNLGGGLGAYYGQGDEVPEPEQLVGHLAQTARDICRSLGLALPQLILEPGRSIVNEAGLTLYRVGGTKMIPGIRNYLFIDGGMTDNIRPALYGSRYETVLANRMHEAASEQYSIAGRCCESGDMVAWNQMLPAAEPGDILAVARTGAYNYSMASNYNRLPRPAVVLVSNRRADLIVERETYSDLIRLDRVPPHLSRDGGAR